MMFKTLFGGTKPDTQPKLVVGQAGKAVRPASKPMQGEDLGSLPALTLEDVLVPAFELSEFPKGLDSLNGGYLLLSDGTITAVLQRADMASTGAGYNWIMKLRQARPSFVLITVSAEQMRSAIGAKSGTGTEAAGRTTQVTNAQAEGYELVEEAIRRDASDVKIDIEETGPRAPLVLVRIRINGDLFPIRSFNDMASVDAFAVMVRALYQTEANAAVLEKSSSLLTNASGRHYARLTLPGRSAIVRFESDTTSTGASTNLRILSYDGKPTLSTDLVGLGFASSQSAVISNAFEAPSGLCLVMGATGMGKTSTIATALRMNPNAAKQSWYGMEQPPEIDIPYMQQLAFGDDDFAEAIKGVLRLDPDLIYVGEILNATTARVAANLAMTGHLVPASLHGNNIETGLRRLIGKEGMQVPLEDVAADSMLQVLIAQRLVPTLCTECRIPGVKALTVETLATYEAMEIEAEGLYVRYEGTGNRCRACNNTGIRKRTVIAEVVQPDAEWIDALRLGGVREAMTVYRSWRSSPLSDPDQTGKTVFEHGVYKASTGLICAQQLAKLPDFHIRRKKPGSNLQKGSAE